MKFQLLLHSHEALTDLSTREKAERFLSFQELAGQLGPKLVDGTILHTADNFEVRRTAHGVEAKPSVAPGSPPLRALILVECDTVEEAIEMAASIRAASNGHVTVCPAFSWSDMQNLSGP